MKRLLISMLAALLCFMLIACEAEDGDDRISVVATMFPQYDFVREIGGERVDTTLLLDFGADAHSYDPTPMDIIEIAKADLFIYNGDEMELWAKKLLAADDVQRAVESGSLYILDLSRHAELLEMHAHGHDDAHEHTEECLYDTHIWTSPKNAQRLCGAIYDALCDIDKESAEYYTLRFGEYSKKLSSLTALADEVLRHSSKREVFFGGSFAFRYLFHDMGLEHHSIFEGCSSHAEISAADIVSLSKQFEDSGAGYIFYDSLSEKKIAEVIAAENGAELLHLHAIHNITRREFESGENYISLMTKNMETLRKALT